MTLRVNLTIGVAIGALCASALLTPVSAEEVPQTNQLSDAGQRAMNEIGACLSDPESRLNVLYVLDASSSLEEDTDPQRLRGKILAQALKQLSTVSKDREVNFAVSSFDTVYTERRPWEKLTISNVNAAVDWANDQYSWWGEGLATDWEAALRGGDETMRASPNFAANSTCKMLVWLTDGGINAGGPTDVTSNTKAMEQICATNPANGENVNSPAIVNGLRSSQIHLIGVLLQSDEFLQSLQDRGDIEGFEREKSKFSYVRPIVEGSGKVDSSFFSGSNDQSFDYSCGASPIPEGQASGALLIGDSPISLAYQFAALGSRIRGGRPVEVGTTFPAEFEVERGINGLSIQLAGQEWRVTDPTGQAIAGSGIENSPGTEVSQQGDLISATIEGPKVTPGTWTIEINDPKAPAQVFGYALIDGFIEVPETPRLGETSSFELVIKDQVTNQTVTRSDYQAGAPEVLIGLQGKPGTSIECVPDATRVSYICEWTPNFVGSSGLSAKLEVSTIGGSPLYTYVGNFPISVAPSAEYPRVDPDQIALTSMLGRKGEATGNIVLRGPEVGSGQVCFPEEGAFTINSDVVDRAESYLITGPAWSTCIDLAQAETKEVAIRISNPVAASGSVAAALELTLISSQSEASQQQQVTLNFDTIRDSSPPWWLLLLLFLIGFLVPVLLLYAQAFAASKLSVKGLQMATVPVLLTFAGDVVQVSRQQPPGHTLFDLNDWQYLPASMDRPRTFTAGDGVIVAAQVPRNPMGPIAAIAEAPAGKRIITSEGMRVGGGKEIGRVGRMGLMPANQWFVVASVDDLQGAGDPVPAVLVGFASPTSGDLSETSSRMSSAAADLQAQSGWLAIRAALRASGETVVTGALDNSHSTDSAGKVAEVDPWAPSSNDAATSLTPTENSARPTDVTDPFGDTSIGQQPNKSNPGGFVSDPFKDI